MIDPTKASFEEFKSKWETFYKQIGTVWCPALNSQINFNSDGFYHLRYDNNRSERSKNEQRNKMLFLKEAVEIIKKTTTIQEFRSIIQAIGKKGKDGFRKTSVVAFYAFFAIVNLSKGVRIRVIIRRVGDGLFHFWSVMPFWKEIPINDGKKRIIGSLELDDG